MTRFFKSKLTLVALVLAGITLITGVTLAATSPAPSSQELSSSVVQIVAVPMTVGVGGRLEIVGAGFTPDDAVLFQVIVGGGAPNVILESGFANSSGAFLTVNEELPADLGAGLYTIQAITLESQGLPVASAPLIVADK